MLSTALLGDVSAAGTLVLGVPNVLMNSSYSRNLEWEADSYALEKMKELNISTDHFSNFMYRMSIEFIDVEDDNNNNDDLFDYISTHPPTDDRIARFRTDEGKRDVDLMDKPEVLTNFELPKQPDVFALRALLEEGKFEELDQVLDQYQINYEEGKGSEITTDLAYEVLANTDPNYESHFDKWVQAMPGAYTAYLARAVYFHKLSWIKRGSKYSKDTGDEQMSSMKEYQARTISDLDKVLVLKPSSMIAYSLLISIASTKKSEDKKWQYMDEALEIDPASYVIRKRCCTFRYLDGVGVIMILKTFLVRPKNILMIIQI